MVGKRPVPNWKVLREALWTRCDGRCEVTGLALDFETFDLHHRRPKGMGGTYRPATDTPVNLLALDPTVHNGSPRSVHQAPSWSRPRGYLLHAGVLDDDLVDTPLLYRGLYWAVLGDDDFKIMDRRSQDYLNRVLTIADQVAQDALSESDQYRRAALRNVRPYGQYS